jgi:hypothetical protein
MCNYKEGHLEVCNGFWVNTDKTTTCTDLNGNRSTDNFERWTRCCSMLAPVSFFKNFLSREGGSYLRVYSSKIPLPLLGWVDLGLAA